jgi:N-acetylmuramoyl-L-alanine amidase
MSLPQPVSGFPDGFDITDDLDILARTIEGEASGETHEGRIAIACVAMNRVAIGKAHRAKFGTAYWWGETPAGVCLAHAQFSSWNADDPNRARILAVTVAEPVFAEAKDIARLAIAGQISDPTNGSTHYINPKEASPDWARGQTPTAVIGRHTFFRLA